MYSRNNEICINQNTYNENTFILIYLIFMSINIFDCFKIHVLDCNDDINDILLLSLI